MPLELQNDPLAPDAISQDINVIPMNFRLDYVPDRNHPGKFREITRLDLVKKGSYGEMTPKTIKEVKQNPALWAFVEPYYEHWKRGQEDPIDGTPLDVLAFLPREIIGHLQNIHIRTAEDLAESGENALERIGMGARGWREKAIVYLKAKEGASMIAEANVELQSKIDQQQGEIDDMREQIAGLVADKPKRGRPFKVGKDG